MIPYKHLSLHKVNNIVRPSQPWCVRWQTACMPVMAFAYYRTRVEALASWPELDNRPIRLIAASRCA